MIACEVPFCSHKRGDRKGSPITEGMLWICGQHWRQVPAELRRRMRRLDRLTKKAEAKSNAWLVARFQRRRHDLWIEARRLAIEISAGITAARPRR